MSAIFISIHKMADKQNFEILPLAFSFESFPLRAKLLSYDALKMFLTNVLMKKVKTRYVKVLLRSTGSTHTRVTFRERLEDKKEEVYFDPYVEMLCIYKEEKKLVSQNPPVNKNYKGVFKPKEI